MLCPYLHVMPVRCSIAYYMHALIRSLQGTVLTFGVQAARLKKKTVCTKYAHTRSYKQDCAPWSEFWFAISSSLLKKCRWKRGWCHIRQQVMLQASTQISRSSQGVAVFPSTLWPWLPWLPWCPNVLQCFKWSSFRHGARPELFLPCGDESWCWRLMQDLLERDKDGDVSGDVMICTDKAPCLSSRLTDLESHLIT